MELVCTNVVMHNESGDASTLNDDDSKMLVFGKSPAAWRVVDLTTLNVSGPLKCYQSGNILHWYKGRPYGLVLQWDAVQRKNLVQLGYADTGEVHIVLPDIKPTTGSDWNWRLNPTSQSVLRDYVWVEKVLSHDDCWLACVRLHDGARDVRKYRDWLGEANPARARMSHESDWWGDRAFVQMPRSGTGFDASDYDKRAWVLKFQQEGKSYDRRPYEHIAVTEREYAWTGSEVRFYEPRVPINPSRGGPNHIHMREDGWLTASVQQNGQLGVEVFDARNQSVLWVDVPRPPGGDFKTHARPVLAKDYVYWHQAHEGTVAVFRERLPVGTPDPPVPPDPPPNGDVDEQIRLHCDAIDAATAAIRGLLGG